MFAKLNYILYCCFSAASIVIVAMVMIAESVVACF